MDELKNSFNDILANANLQEKKIMLTQVKTMIKTLVNSIQVEEQIVRNGNHNIDDYVDYFPEYINSNDSLMEGLKKDLLSLNIHSGDSKKVKSVWFGEKGYSYGDTVHPPKKLDESWPALRSLMDKINKDEKCGSPNREKGALIAYLPSGAASQRKHADDEHNVIDQSEPISTLSVGCDRKIEFYAFNSKKDDPPLKTLLLKEGSLHIMKGGCQRIFKHRVPPHPTTGGRWCISWRSLPEPAKSPLVIPSNVDNGNMLESSMDNDTSLSSIDLFPGDIPYKCTSESKPFKCNKKSTTIILGTSQQVELVENRLAKGTNTCINLSKSGNKIKHIDETVDEFYIQKSNDHIVKNIILAVGINDIRFCKRGINHLKSPLLNLINKLKDYFPLAKIYIESVLPIYIKDQYTVPNILKYNDMLYNICIMTHCLYLDTYSSFFIPGTYLRNVNLYKGPLSVHLNRRGLAVLAREYIFLINNRKFNPLGY